MTLPITQRRRLFASTMVTLDGFMDGPNGELDWHAAGSDFDRYCEEMLSSIEAIVLGRVSYEMMADYWIAAEQKPSSAAELAIARWMNRLPKLVLSRTLTAARWNGRIVSGDLGAEFERLKAEHGRDIAVFGGGTAVSSLIRLGLIDEFRLIVSPVVLGSGRPVFPGLEQRLRLALTRSATLRSGGVILYYEPERSLGRDQPLADS